MDIGGRRTWGYNQTKNSWFCENCKSGSNTRTNRGRSEVLVFSTKPSCMFILWFFLPIVVNFWWLIIFNLLRVILSVGLLFCRCNMFIIFLMIRYWIQRTGRRRFIIIIETTYWPQWPWSYTKFQKQDTNIIGGAGGLAELNCWQEVYMYSHSRRIRSVHVQSQQTY